MRAGTFEFKLIDSSRVEKRKVTTRFVTLSVILCRRYHLLPPSDHWQTLALSHRTALPLKHHAATIQASLSSRSAVLIPMPYFHNNKYKSRRGYERRPNRDRLTREELELERDLDYYKARSRRLLDDFDVWVRELSLLLAACNAQYHAAKYTPAPQRQWRTFVCSTNVWI